MIARIEGWHERAAQLAREIEDRAPQQYKDLGDEINRIRPGLIKDRQAKLDALLEKDHVAHRWLAVLDAAADLAFDLERLALEVACRAERNGVVLGSTMPTTASVVPSPQAQ